nr:unnamed protein product [Callosobruchus analis]
MKFDSVCHHIIDRLGESEGSYCTLATFSPRSGDHEERPSESVASSGGSSTSLTSTSSSSVASSSSTTIPISAASPPTREKSSPYHHHHNGHQQPRRLQKSGMGAATTSTSPSSTYLPTGGRHQDKYATRGHLAGLTMPVGRTKSREHQLCPAFDVSAFYNVTAAWVYGHMMPILSSSENFLKTWHSE